MSSAIILCFVGYNLVFMIQCVVFSGSAQLSSGCFLCLMGLAALYQFLLVRSQLAFQEHHEQRFDPPSHRSRVVLIDRRRCRAPILLVVLHVYRKQNLLESLGTSGGRGTGT